MRAKTRGKTEVARSINPNLVRRAWSKEGGDADVSYVHGQLLFTISDLTIDVSLTFEKLIDDNYR